MPPKNEEMKVSTAFSCFWIYKKLANMQQYAFFNTSQILYHRIWSRLKGRNMPHFRAFSFSVA